MRTFLITTILAVASAAPQYNYEGSNSNVPLGFSKFNGNSGGGSTPVEQSLLQEALQNRQLAQTILGPNSSARQSVGYQQQIQQQQQQVSYGQQLPINGIVLQQQAVPQVQHVQQAASLQPQQQQFNYQSLSPIVTKDIYVHAAPEEREEKYNAIPQQIVRPRKHYRIVFIKAPTQSISPATLRLTQAPTEEKTIIYVLSKKQDPLDLQTVLQEVAPKQPSKPEVYFIKYKTQEEAAHAQRTIQAQFDSLGGTSQISDEGIAPVTSVIGSLQNQQQPGVQQEPSGLDGPGISLSNNEGSSYLPPSH